MNPFNAAVTFLFSPATRLDRVEKALVTSADVVIVDLEDAVRMEEKIEARSKLAAFEPGASLCVRINDATTEFYEDDVAFVTQCSWVSSVMLPKVQSGDDVRRFRHDVQRDVAIFGLVESASAMVALDDIANSGASRLFFGSVDYSTDLSATPNNALFIYPRSRLVVASAAAGIASPIDGPTLAIHDMERLGEDSRQAQALGMGGKLCIHPSQIATVESIFASSLFDEKWARAVIEGFEENRGGVFVLDGQMIDNPVVTRAKRILGM